MKKIYYTILLGLLPLAQRVFAGQDSTTLPELINPLGKDATIMTVINSVFKYLARFAIVIAPLFIIWGAFLMLTSAGNAEKFNSGKKAILYAVIGLIVVLMARGIVAILKDAFTNA